MQGREGWRWIRHVDPPLRLGNISPTEAEKFGAVREKKKTSSLKLYNSVIKLEVRRE
jgi:hypothetical protein